MALSPVEFERPPVVELVLGVQFGALANLTSGHLGWFWKKFLDGEWDRARDAMPIAEQFETFEEQRRGRVPGVEFRLQAAAPLSRLQISNRAGDRLIQIQPTRFHYNWQRKGAKYPSFGEVSAEFDQHFVRFQDFLAEAELGKPRPNQWELTYVDRVPRGELWQSVADWHRVLPGLVAPLHPCEGLSPESVGGEWSFEIAPRRGRLHVSVSQARLAEEQETALLLQMTARGPVGNGAEPDLKAGLDLGHAAAVRAFLHFTSAEAKRHWGLKA